MRHAHTGLAGRFCGRLDPPLSEQGRRQLSELVKELAKYPLTHIFSSDLLRSRQTASFIAAELGPAVEILPSLREVSFGDWEGLNWEAVSKRDAAYAERWMEQYPRFPAPGGEEFDGFRERVRGAMAEVALSVSGGCAAVVTHGGVMRTFMLDVLNLPVSALASLEYEYASCTALYQEAGRWCLQD